MEGRSLVPFLNGAPAADADQPVVCCEATWMCKWAFIENGHKLIVAREPDIYGKPPLELYDLEVDPAELTNLASTQPQLVSAMLARFEEWLAQQLARTGETADPLRAHGSVRDKLLRPLSPRQKMTRGIKRWWRGLRARR
jgi:hypothetical protein